MNDLTNTFKTASHYRIDLPSSEHLAELFDAKMLERLNRKGLESATEPYQVFLTEAKHNMQSFLQTQGEDSSVGIDAIHQLFGPVTAGLEFSASEETRKKLQDSLSEVFADFPFTPENKAKGYSWNNLPVQRYGNKFVLGLA